MFSNKFRSTGVVIFVLTISSVFLFSSSLRDSAEAAGAYDVASKKKTPDPPEDPLPDPLASFHYALELEGSTVGFFTEASGMGSENEVVEQKVVDETGVEITRKIPGRFIWSEITLRRGITSNLDVWVWREQVEAGNIQEARKNGSVVMFDGAFTEVARWDFENGWPSKLVAGSSLGATEELTIVHEGLTRTN